MKQIDVDVETVYDHLSVNLWNLYKPLRNVNLTGEEVVNFKDAFSHFLSRCGEDDLVFLSSMYNFV